MDNLLFPFDSWDEHSVHKQPQRHNSWQLVSRKEKKRSSRTPCLFWAPQHVWSNHSTDGRKRRASRTQLFNSLHCKHDLFEWWGKSQDILVWAGPPLATTNSHGTVSPLRKTFRYKSSRAAWIKPNASRLSVLLSACKAVTCAASLC